jgi:hypothetical protein
MSEAVVKVYVKFLHVFLFHLRIEFLDHRVRILLKLRELPNCFSKYYIPTSNVCCYSCCMSSQKFGIISLYNFINVGFL